MPDIALVTPTSLESEKLRQRIEPHPSDKQGILSKGFLHGKTITFSHCGIGKVNAAHAATIILEKEKIDLVIHFGIAGSYTAAAAMVGDIVVAESENYAEEGIMTPDGWRSMEHTGFHVLHKGIEYFNTFNTDEKLRQLAISASKECGLRVHSGNFVTVSQCSGTAESGRIMKQRFDGLCENMEGAAVAHICAIYGIPMVEIRGISNIIEDRNMSKWDIPLAVTNCNKAVSELIKRL